MIQRNVVARSATGMKSEEFFTLVYPSAEIVSIYISGSLPPSEYRKVEPLQEPTTDIIMSNQRTTPERAIWSSEMEKTLIDGLLEEVRQG